MADEESNGEEQKVTHVSDKGIAPCRAKSRDTCPMTLNGEKAPHFSDPEQAQRVYESTMEKKNPPVVSKPEPKIASSSLGKRHYADSADSDEYETVKAKLDSIVANGGTKKVEQRTSLEDLEIGDEDDYGEIEMSYYESKDKKTRYYVTETETDDSATIYVDDNPKQSSYEYERTVKQWTDSF